MQPIKAKEENFPFGFVTILNGIIVDEGFISGSKITFSKEAKMRAVLAALKRIKKRNGFDKNRILIGAGKWYKF